MHHAWLEVRGSTHFHAWLSVSVLVVQARAQVCELVFPGLLLHPGLWGRMHRRFRLAQGRSELLAMHGGLEVYAGMESTPADVQCRWVGEDTGCFGLQVV